MKRFLLLTIALFTIALPAFATGDAATYFNVYVPAGNENSRKDVYVVVTALYDNTSFSIADDGADGDTDDSKSGILMQGQSYVLFLRENGINDDAAHPGEANAKQDGDYLVITSNKAVTAVQGTLSAWQHDWATSFNKTSKGEQFVIYSNTTNGSSVNDLNVFAYEDSTTVVVRKISLSALNKQGFTKVDMAHGTVVMTKTIQPGKDLIHYFSDGKDILQAGETYVVTANKPVTVQYGALAGDSRDAGGYVPSSNGLSSGSLFYFAVPYQSGGAQEIRITSWDDNNDIILERYTAAGWVNVKTFRNVKSMKPVDWIGATYGKSYANEFRVSCTPGKRVSVLEANFMETGTPGSADMATMAATANGTAADKTFLVYMAPPSRQNKMTNPFTGRKLTDQTHAYVYARTKCIVIVKDANTNGTKINRKYTIEAGSYADVSLDMYDWKSIFNGTGLAASGSDRPYLIIQATDAVTVMAANTNDNWLMSIGSPYAGNSQQNMTVAASNGQDTTTAANSLQAVAENPAATRDTISTPTAVTHTIEADSTDNTVVAPASAPVTLSVTKVNALPAQLSVYPNPLTDGDITIRLSAEQSLQAITVASIEGRILLNQNDINAQEFRIARSSFQQAGMYIIMLKDNNDNQYSSRIEVR